jgi:hypothetical protein
MTLFHQIARPAGSAIFPDFAGKIPPGGKDRLSHNRARLEQDI